jgi:hypothetical protein
MTRKLLCQQKMWTFCLFIGKIILIGGLMNKEFEIVELEENGSTPTKAEQLDNTQVVAKPPKVSILDTYGENLSKK